MTRKRYDIGQSSFIDHTVRWIAAGDSARLFEDLLAELAWERREIVLFGRRIWQPRLIAWAGELPYRYSGQTLPARPFTPRVAKLLTAVIEAVGTPFNHVLANRYRDGTDSMGLHADAEAELGPDPVVATLSFGSSRRMRILPRDEQQPKFELVLGSGDLVVMAGACQREAKHGIPRARANEAVGERISLTFRQVLRPPQG